MGLLGWGWLDLGLGRVLQECRNEGTPLGQRGIAAVAGGHCVGLPLKCNHRAEQSRAEPAPEAAIKRGVEKQSRYRQPPPPLQGHALAKMSKLAGGGQQEERQLQQQSAQPNLQAGQDWAGARAEQVSGVGSGLGRGRVAGCKRVIAKQLPSCKD